MRKIATLLLLTTLAACGQKGPLYLPRDTAAPATKAQAPANATQTPSAEGPAPSTETPAKDASPVPPPPAPRNR